LQFVKLLTKIINSKTFKEIIAIIIKNKLNLEISENNKLINLTKLAISEKKIDKLGKLTLKAMFLSAKDYNKYIQIFLYKIKVLRI
jgi:hypothetical protein